MKERNYFITEELNHHKKAFSNNLAAYDEIVVINADQEESKLLILLLLKANESHNNRETPYKITFVTYKANEISTDQDDIPDEVTMHSDYKRYRKSSGSKSLFIIFKNKSMDIDYVHKQVKFFGKYPDSNPEDRLVYISESYLDNFKSNKYWEVSEEEYAVLVERLSDDAIEKQDYAIDESCEKLFDQDASVTVLRYNNLFGPTISADTVIADICKKAKKDEEIVFETNDKNIVRSYTFVCDLLTCIGRLVALPTKDFSYNLNSYILSDYHIKNAFSTCFPALATKYPNKITEENVQYCALQRKKINQCNPRSKFSFSASIEKTYLSLQSNTYIDSYFCDKIAKSYGGKIKAVREREVEILQEISRICQKYEIKYFLVGGSLLGSVRHRGFIPWDDDLDIGMLREDYEKFRQIAPHELNNKFYYQSYKNDDGSHYVFDKIRVNGTTFSTNWSANFDINDGIFVDILTYDKTSNIKLFQKIHVKLILIAKRAINIKWINKPRKKVHYTLSIVALPLMRLVPYKFLHFIFEATVKLYGHSRKSMFLLDSVGMNIKKVGGFPSVWFTDLTTGIFEGNEVPITSHYEDCLKLWYGENYMELLLPSKRKGHQITAINLGGHIEDYEK